MLIPITSMTTLDFSPATKEAVLFSNHVFLYFVEYSGVLISEHVLVVQIPIKPKREVLCLPGFIHIPSIVTFWPEAFFHFGGKLVLVLDYKVLEVFV